ncbi:unnamed protein product [Mortierella alpina]
MDPTFPLDGFIYTPLNESGNATDSNSPISSWPSFDGVLGFFLTQMDNQQQQQQQEQQQQQCAMDTSFSINQLSDGRNQNLTAPPIHSSSSLPTILSLPSSAPCHPFDPSPLATSAPNSMDILSSMPSTNLNMNNLTPFYNIPPRMSQSRSSSTSSLSCVDPASLMLSPAFTAASSCSSTPQSRRLSTFSTTGGADSEDDQHRMMRSLFENHFSMSSPAATPPAAVDSDYFSTSRTAAAPSSLFRPSCCCPTGLSPMLTPAAFVDQSTLLDSSFPFLIPPHVSVADYSHMDSIHSTKTLPKHSTPSRVCKSLPSARRAPFRTAARRGSTDSAYSSSSSLGVKCSSGSKKYRKDGAGEFQCPFEGCTYRYNLRRELNRHSNVHAFAGRDKYRCVNCNSGLCRLDSVKRHMEAKGKAECLKKGLYQEFRENGELVRVRRCKPSWYEAAAANAAAAAAAAKKKGMEAVRCSQ